MRPALVPADASLGLASMSRRSVGLTKISRLKPFAPAVTAWRRGRLSLLTHSTVSIFVRAFSRARSRGVQLGTHICHVSIRRLARHLSTFNQCVRSQSKLELQARF